MSKDERYSTSVSPTLGSLIPGTQTTYAAKVKDTETGNTGEAKSYDKDTAISKAWDNLEAKQGPTESKHPNK